MTKKIFLILSITFAILLSGTVVFANLGDSIRQGANDMGNQAKESWDKASNSVQNATNTVASGVSNMMNGDDNNNDNNNNSVMGMTDNTNDNRYTAQRTSAEGPMSTMNSTMWTWLILAVLGVVIVSLVWFYGSQFKRTKHHEE